MGQARNVEKADPSDGSRDGSDAMVIPAIDAAGGLYPVGKMEAQRLGLLHLAVSVFVFSGEALLIQRRAATKYHCAGLWANTCCTHPHWGESVEAAARRRLAEEIGLITALTETRIVDYRADVGCGLIEHERVHMFRGQVDRGAVRFAPDPGEVEATRWITPDMLAREIATDPQAFAPWFRIYVERFPTLAF